VAASVPGAPPLHRSPLVISGAIGACVGLLISAVFGVRGLAQTQADAAAQPVVEVATVAPGRIRAELLYTGLVQAPQQATVTSLTAGTLTSVAAEVGSTVRAGDRLGNLTTESLPAQLQQAQADLRAAEARRAQLLSGARATDVDSARAVLAAAEAKLAQLQEPSDVDVAGARATLANAESTLAANEAAIETNRALLFGAIANACNTPLGQGIPVPCSAAEAPLSAQVTEDLSAFLQSRAGDRTDLGARAVAVLQANNAYRNTFSAVEASKQSAASARAKLGALLSPSAADLTSAQAQVQVARDTLANRLNPYTSADIEAASAAIARAAAQVAIAEANLARTAIVAPFDGTVAQRLVEPGANVSAQAPLFVIVGRGAQVHVTLRDSDTAGIQPGTPVEVTTPGAGAPAAGRVLTVAPAGDMRAHTLEVRVAVEDRAGALRPGTLAQVRLITSEKTDALGVPSTALTLHPQGARVWVVADGKAQPREVAVGISDRTTTEITQGLRAGDLVIVRGSHTLREGQPVKPQPLVASK
jgi:multidrug efflux pump subunit AcrA (membrane-fusion protein)